MADFFDPSPLKLDPVIRVRRLGSLHIGGRSARLSDLPTRQVSFSPGAPLMRLDPNGDFEIEQMYAQYVQLEQARSACPVLLMHGGGLSGVSYETTPDGRSGWQEFFLRAGYDVWTADAVERGRASWARSPEFFAGEPIFRSKQEAWELFRLGPAGSWHADPALRQPYKDTRFPVTAFDQFMKQSVPRWATNDAATAQAYAQLVRSRGPFVLIAHSQGCNFAFQMACALPDQVRAVVALEPSGFTPVSDEALGALRQIPHLFIWGDYLEQAHPMWSQVVPRLQGWRERLQAQGGVADEWNLPALGLRGNSHQLMMDDNSDVLAAAVHRWLVQRLGNSDGRRP